MSDSAKELAGESLPVRVEDDLQYSCNGEEVVSADSSKKGKLSLLGRYEKVITVLVKYGFADVVAYPPFNRIIPKWEKLIPRHEGRPVTTYTRFERVRMVCEELGTTFIKFAQIASNRPDLLPEELIEQLATFQDNANPIPTEVVREVLIKEFGKPPEEVFEYFNPEPVASASMSQVHRVRLLGGREAVLKVQRPCIEETVDLDIVILTQLSRLLERHFPATHSYQPLELVKMFEKSIRKELDFSIEAANMRRFEMQFKGNDDIYVPTLYPEYSTKKVLCMEYIEGVKITSLEELAEIGMTGPQLALKGINLYFEQVFTHGFFHADPHPGNIFIMPDKKVCFIDFGMMGTVTESDRLLLGDMLLAIYNQDVAGLKQALLRFSWDEAAINEKDLEYDILDFFQDYTHIGIGDIDSGEVMAALNSLFFDYKIKVPSNLLLLLKALVIIEGVGLILDPKYDIIANIEPFARRLIERKFSPAKMSKSLFKSMGDLTKLASSLPADAQEVINKIKKGNLHIQFEHRGLDEVVSMLSILSKRISFAIVLAALILGSSLLMVANVPPYFRNIPALGFFGFIVSALLSLRLLISIMRNRKF